MDNFFLIGPDDKRLAEMMAIVKSCHLKKSPDPLVVIDIDLASYLKYMQELTPQQSALSVPAPDMDNLTLTISSAAGRISAVISMALADIRNWLAYTRRTSALRE